MIPIDKAEQILNAINIKPNKTESVPVLQSLNRTLSQPVISQINMPPFNKSAMDGYAINSSDHSEKFQIIETVPAGYTPTKPVQTGQCAKIMTGAMLPKNTDKVIKVEITKEENGFMIITDTDDRANICLKGEDIRIGDTILEPGHTIRPQEAGIIASMGLAEVNVYQKPTVGIITTGSEIIPPGQPLKPGQIYNSNAYSLSTQAMAAGAITEFKGIVEDDKENIKRHIKNMLDRNQLVLISGGVSMGDYDFVPDALKEIGARIHFDKVAIQPGKPTVFATYEDKLIFGMPGNPVSTFTIFEVFVKPTLYRMMGKHHHPEMLKGIMNKTFTRKRTERTLFIPVKYNDGLVHIQTYHGSAHLAALSGANALLKIPTGEKTVPEGTTVHVRQI